MRAKRGEIYAPGGKRPRTLGCTLPFQLYERLRATAFILDVPYVAIVRQGIEDQLAQHEVLAPGLAAKIEELLAERKGRLRPAGWNAKRRKKAPG